jgi:naphthoate synthase/2-ketocyclohexanecarboxyl-CoA hydrolase
MGWSIWERVTGDGFDFEEIVYEKHRHDETQGAVARVTMNRPERRNAMTMRMVDEMFRAFYDANHDPTVGAIILTGAGEHFGAGGDVEWERWGLREAFYFRYPANRLLRISRKPVIAMVRGYCIGGSNHLAYCCDFTLADETAIFGQAGPRVSSPADGYFVPYLARVVGAKKAREMWMLCRRYAAPDAERMGLVNKVVAPDQLEAEVDQWCEEMLALSPGCLEVLKATFDQELDGFAEMGVISSALYPDWFDSPEGKEGGAAFVEKRPPRFWSLRQREAQARQQLADEHESRRT